MAEDEQLRPDLVEYRRQVRVAVKHRVTDRVGPQQRGAAVNHEVREVQGDAAGIATAINISQRRIEDRAAVEVGVTVEAQAVEYGVAFDTVPANHNVRCAIVAVERSRVVKHDHVRALHVDVRIVTVGAIRGHRGGAVEREATGCFRVEGASDAVRGACRERHIAEGRCPNI